MTDQKKLHPANYVTMPELVERAYQLVKTGNEQRLELLRSQLLKEKDALPYSFVFWVADELYALDDEVGVRFFNESLQSEHSNVRFEGAFWLAKRDRKDALSILIEGMKSEHDYERYWAARYLAKLCDKRAITTLLQLLDDNPGTIFSDDVANVLCEKFSGVAEVLAEIRKRVALATGDEYVFEGLLETLSCLDATGQELGTFIAPYLKHSNVEISGATARVIMNNYLDRAYPEAVKLFEENFGTMDTEKIVQWWRERRT